ncbi:MAG: hypothetical protein JW726_10860 [Anaerolineales bacterium]|nr:hypothetical protein [Anaerolineales bacterium]
MYTVLFVLHDCDKLEALLEAWESVGVQGATIMHSSGLGRLRTGTWRDDVPLIPSLESLYEYDESFSRTLFTVIEDEEMIDHLVAATQKVVGDLSQADTGLLVVMPVLRAYGITKSYHK